MACDNCDGINFIYQYHSGVERIVNGYGLPEVLVRDNGPQFTSGELQTFLKANLVTHARSAPFHPATNGLAERFVQTFKRALFNRG